MTETRSIPSRHICGVRVDAVDYAQVVTLVVEWARRRESRYVCVANVHMVMEAFDSRPFQTILNAADLVTSDGMPLVWGLRLLGLRASRVYGPDLTPQLLAAASYEGLAVGFYGGSRNVLEQLSDYAAKSFPGIRIAYQYSPPFRPLTPEEQEAQLQAMRDAGVQVLFVGLGCPKQERWMAENYAKVPAVMLGVGAAFDFLTGAKPQAPRWMMAVGLEWLFRLLTEPRRLWARYLKQNPRFVAAFARQLVTERSHGKLSS